MKARHYQDAALHEIRSLITKGEKRILLHLATGAGKTFIFCKILTGCSVNKIPCLMVVRGRTLVAQASKRLSEMNVEHGVLMSGYPQRLDLAVQIISIDTSRTRDMFPPAKFVVIDEAHFATSPSFVGFLSHYDDAVWISVTATPYHANGLGHLANVVVKPISIGQLFEEKFLVKPKYFAPSKFDTSQIKKVNGEFDEQEALEQFEKQVHYGEMFKTWERFCEGQPSLYFAINVEHATKIHEQMIARGIAAEIITAKTPLEERDYMYQALDKGLLEVIVSVGTLTTGVDIPCIRNIVFCRPTASKNLFIQMIGRGTRPYLGKDHFKVIDHVGNISRLGFIEDEPPAELKAREKNLKAAAPSGLRTCPGCYAIVVGNPLSCPECDYELRSVDVLPNLVVDVEMIELEPQKVKFKKRCEELLRECTGYNYRVGWIWHQLVAEFGEDECRKRYKVYRGVKIEHERLSGATSEDFARLP